MQFQVLERVLLEAGFMPSRDELYLEGAISPKGSSTYRIEFYYLNNKLLSVVNIYLLANCQFINFVPCILALAIVSLVLEMII